MEAGGRICTSPRTRRKPFRRGSELDYGRPVQLSDVWRQILAVLSRPASIRLTRAAGNGSPTSGQPWVGASLLLLIASFGAGTVAFILKPAGPPEGIFALLGLSLVAKTAIELAALASTGDGRYDVVLESPVPPTLRPGPDT